MTTGKVFFVGAGPGDPKLITVKGLELIKRADVIVHDRLASPKLLKELKEDVKLIYCGKESNKHTLVQEEINAVLVKEAKEGKLVVRLKGGDPCIFGRVGEEAEECVKHDIPFEIIPGITSGIAAPAYAGIPLTHREYNASVAIITGHRSEKNGAHVVDLEKVSRMETIVIYMGMKNLANICVQLIQYGRDPMTPVALVRWGTTGEQETLVGDLTNISQKAKQYQFGSPAIIVVGDVVKLRDQLNWYESKVLLGKKVLFLDHPNSARKKALQLEDWGAEVICEPAYQWKTVQNQKWTEFAARMEHVSWIVLASRMEAQFFLQFLREQRMDIRRIQANLVACGKDTAEFLEDKGMFPTLVLKDQSISLKSILDGLQIQSKDEVLVLNQAGNGIIKTELINGITVHITSFYEKQYVQIRHLNQLIQKEKIDFVITTQTHPLLNLTSLTGDAQVLIVSEEGQWTENDIADQLHEKVQCIS